MKEYIRAEVTVFEFDAEDVITTSSSSYSEDGIRQRNNPVYTNGTNDSNWLIWLQ